jgi:hypothetical protein
MPVDAVVDGEVDAVDNRTRAVQLRAQGLSMAKIGEQLGISAQGVHKLLKTAQLSSLPVARMEAASRTLAELAEATRADLAETFRLGASRAKRRIREVHDLGDDAAAKTVLETAKLATEGARVVHGWGETNASGGGRVAIQVIGDLRGLVKEKTVQEVEVEQVATNSGVVDDSDSHSIEPKQAENEAKPA